MMMACYSRCKSLSQPCYILYVSSGFLLALCNKQSTVVDFRPVKFISDARPPAQYIYTETCQVLLMFRLDFDQVLVGIFDPF